MTETTTEPQSTEKILDLSELKALQQNSELSEVEQKKAINDLLIQSGIDEIDDSLSLESFDEELKKIKEDLGVIDSVAEAAVDDLAENVTEDIETTLEKTDTEQTTLPEAEEIQENKTPEEDLADTEISPEQQAILDQELNESGITKPETVESEKDHPPTGNEPETNKEIPTDNAEETTDQKSETITKNSPEHHEGIDTDFENFLNNQLENGEIDAETIQKAKASLDDPEAQTLLKMFGNITAFNFGTTIAEPLVIGGVIASTLSLSSAMIAWLAYNGTASVVKSIWLRLKGVNNNWAAAPFGGQISLINELTTKHPELVNLFFAEKLSKRAKRKSAEAKADFEAENSKEEPNIDELKYLKKQIKKWEQKEKQKIESGMEYIPKINQRVDKVKEFGKKVGRGIAAPFKWIGKTLASPFK